MGFLLIIGVVIFIVWLVKSDSYDAARIKNSISTWATDNEGLCNECKHCYRDESGNWICSLSKCNNISEDTRMKCFEKPTVTENDLKLLFDLGVWTQEGQNYIRESILGKKMTFSEIDEFLKEVPIKFPDYIDQNYIDNLNE